MQATVEDTGWDLKCKGVSKSWINEMEDEEKDPCRSWGERVRTPSQNT
jgi:hypothetical protein